MNQMMKHAATVKTAMTIADKTDFELNAIRKILTEKPMRSKLFNRINDRACLVIRQ